MSVNASNIPAERGRLLWRIARRFATVTEDVAVGPVRLRFTRVADPNRVLDEMAVEEDRKDKLAGRRRPDEELNLPYWAELWDSAAGVADYLASVLFPAGALRGMNVLDLGCGMGLTGTVAAALGARVTFADLSPEALLFARLNSLPFADQVRTRQLNWRTAKLNERFDLIIGADILYERGQWMYLEPFWRGHLKPAGTILLGEPGRATGDYFIDWIAAWPWAVEHAARKVPTREKPIRLLVLRPR